MAAVEKLQYSRLRRKKTDADGKVLRRKNIALLLMGMDRSLVSLPSVASGIHGTESALAELGARVLLADLPRVDHHPEFLARSYVHGVLAKGALQAAWIRQANRQLIQQLKETPTVWFLGRPNGADWGDVVESNDVEVGQLAARHLLEKGHRRMALLDPKPRHVTLSQRCGAFAWAAEQAGAEVTTLRGRASNGRLPFESVGEFKQVDQLVSKVLALRPKPTAIFVPADCIAALVYRSFARRGLCVGKDASLISCNNELPLLTGLYPELTTIDICAERIGRQAVEQLIWRLENREAPKVAVSIEPQLVEGMSVADLN